MPISSSSSSTATTTNTRKGGFSTPSSHTARTSSAMSSSKASSTTSRATNSSKQGGDCRCSVCGKLPFKQPDNILPLLAEQEVGLEFEAGVYEFLYRTNNKGNGELNAEQQQAASPAAGKSNNHHGSMRLPETAAQNAADRCTRHTRRLQSDLIKGGLLNAEGQKISEFGTPRVVAPLSIEEINLGRLLGTGGFSSVFEVVSLSLDSSKKYNSQDEEARETMKRNALVLRDVKIEKLEKGGKHSHETSGKSKQAAEPLYAIKFLRRGLTKEPEKFERAAIDMVLEAQLLLAMDHPNIVSLRGWSSEGVRGYASGRHSAFFVIIDRLVESLDERLATWRNALRKYKGRTKLPWGKQKFCSKLDSLTEERLAVVHDVSSALEYMHGRRIINRDLKASNIGFDMNGNLKLFDFGLSRLLPSRRSAMHDGYKMSRVGTKYYMAPEVRAKAPYNLSADIYSFGVVAWEIMSVSSPRETLQRIKKDELVPSRRCMLPICPCWPAYVQFLIERCLNNDPHYRPHIGDVSRILETGMDESGSRYGLSSRSRSSFQLDITTLDTTNNSHTSTTDFRTSLTSETCDTETMQSASVCAPPINFGA